MFAKVDMTLIMERHSGEQLEENKQRSDVILFILKDHPYHNLEKGRTVHESGDYIRTLYCILGSTGR